MAGKDLYNTIVVSPEPRGRFVDGIASAAFKPGTFVQADAAVATVGGKHTFEALGAAASANRGAIGIVVEDNLQGKTVDDAYAIGERLYVYYPLPGDELLALVLSGEDTTADIAGDIDAAGKVVAATGEGNVAFLEDAGTVAADELVHVQFSG